MKKFLLLLICFTLFGCPKSHFFEYKEVFKPIATDLDIKVGYLHLFDKKQKHLIVVSITDDINVLEKERCISSSSKIGTLEKVKRDNTLVFTKPMKFKSERKNIDFIRGDTIHIRLVYKNSHEENLEYVYY